MAIPEPVSNVSFESLVQSLKHDLEMISIDAGTQIDLSEHEANADSPSVKIADPGSNVSSES
jgi:hypothetical protein